MTYHLPSDKTIYAFSPDNMPALRVESGAVVQIDTCDCFENQLQTPADTLETLDWDRINPATGPVYVEGALPGGVLKVSIESLEIGEQGVMATGAGMGVLGDRLEGVSQRYLPFVDGKAVWDDVLSLPMNPMIGVIGVAPAAGSINNGTPGSHGGNMDTKLIAEGTTLYLPVFTEGALFACGDLHAVMGDGEVCVSGVETPGSVRVRLEALPELSLTNPLLETADAFVTIASAETLDEAVVIAVNEMADIVAARTPLALADVVMLMSAVGNAQISQVVDPLKTARFTMPKWALEPYGFAL